MVYKDAGARLNSGPVEAGSYLPSEEAGLKPVAYCYHTNPIAHFISPKRAATPQYMTSLSKNGRNRMLSCFKAKLPYTLHLYLYNSCGWCS